MDMIEAGNEQFFINMYGKLRKVPPKGRDYRLYRRINTEKRENKHTFEYGVGEFFYDSAGNIISYNENPPNLKYDYIDDIVMNIEMLSQVLNKPIILLDELDGMGIEIKKENLDDVRVRQQEKKRKDEAEKNRRLYEQELFTKNREKNHP